MYKGSLWQGDKIPVYCSHCRKELVTSRLKTNLYDPYTGEDQTALYLLCPEVNLNSATEHDYYEIIPEEEQVIGDATKYRWALEEISAQKA